MFKKIKSLIRPKPEPKPEPLKVNNVVSWRGWIGIVIEFIDEQNAKVYVPLMGKTFNVVQQGVLVLQYVTITFNNNFQHLYRAGLDSRNNN